MISNVDDNAEDNDNQYMPNNALTSTIIFSKMDDLP